MKTYKAIAEMRTYLQVKITANSEEEAYQKAKELCGSEFIEIEDAGSWEIYNVAEE
ncbi:hypothetical protein [Roseivirga seohaensis]|uniref:hypothetical protein n=1 Tax=Roseivirga seohaensis TaxID=1914963 RepID=UPI000AD906AB|nr:hypothetical protein [Roseivirga seohaensis]